jgi:hypothetical protein
VSRRRWWTLLLAVAFVIVFGVRCFPDQARALNRVLAPNPALFNRDAYRHASALSPSREAKRYSVLVLQATDARMVPILRRSNPSLKIFVYQDLAYSRATDPGGATACTGLPADLAMHTTWFLPGPSGNRVLVGSDYLMDVGNAAYQAACIAHAVQLAKHDGFNGIFFDGVSASLAFEYPGNVKPTSLLYPTLKAWQHAMYSMLTYAGRVIHAAGLQVIGNIGGSVITPGLWQLWNGPLDGAEEESWTDGGDGLAQQLPWWREKLADLVWSEAHGKYDLLHSYNTTEAGNAYGLASMLLAAEGHSSYATSNGNVLSYEVWYPEYTDAQRLGGPLGTYSRRQNGVYQRSFANGLVLVNPTGHTVPRFTLSGGPYTDASQRTFAPPPWDRPAA